MSKVDQFESRFRAAIKEVYQFRPPTLQRVLVITDLDNEAAETFADACREFLDVLGDVQWTTVGGDRFHNVAELLALVVDEDPDLICTYRKRSRLSEYG